MTVIASGHCASAPALTEVAIGRKPKGRHERRRETRRGCFLTASVAASRDETPADRLNGGFAPYIGRWPAGRTSSSRPRGAHDQSHARSGLAGESADPNGLHLCERWRSGSNHDRIRHGGKADFGRLSLQPSSWLYHHLTTNTRRLISGLADYLAALLCISLCDNARLAQSSASLPLSRFGHSAAARSRGTCWRHALRQH